MAEYAGYVAPTPVDFGAISSGLLSNRLAVEKLKKSEKSDALKLLQKQQAADEKARIQARKEETEDEKMLRSDLESITSAEYIPEKSFNTFASQALENIKGSVFELNKLKKEGKITNQEYLVNYNNLKDQWNQFTAGVKSFKGNLDTLSKDVREGKMSKIGAGLVGVYANTGQLANKVLKVKDVNGVRRLQQYTIDKDGNEIEDETITNIGTLANGSLFADYAVDYNKKFKEAEEAIGKYTAEQSNVTISDKTKKANFDKQLQTQIDGIIPSDLDKARLLTEKLDYDFYFTEQQKNELLAKGKDEKKLVKFALNDKGAYSPFLTKEQKDAAYEYTKENIVGRMDYSKTLDEPKTTANAGDKNKLTQTDKDAVATYKTSERAYNELISGNSNKIIKDLTDLWKQRYEEGAVAKPLYKNGKLVGAAIYTLNEQKQPEREVDRALSIKDFFRLYTPKSRQGQEYVDFERAAEILGKDLNNL